MTRGYCLDASLLLQHFSAFCKFIFTNHGLQCSLWTLSLASWLRTQRSRPTEPASWGPSCMAVSPGHCAHDKSESSMLSTCATSDAFWTSPGRTRSQTTQSWPWKKLDAPACSCCWNRDVHAGSATSYTWTTDGSPKTSSTENLSRENVPHADHSCNCARGT